MSKEDIVLDKVQQDQNQESDKYIQSSSDEFSFHLEVQDDIV